MGVSVRKLIDDFNLEILVEGSEDINVSVNDINRPGLQLAGFYNYFAPERIQVIGKAEWSFLDDMQRELRKKRVKKYFTFDIKCLVITRGLEPHEEFIKEAQNHKVWVLRTKLVTTQFISKTTIYLADKFQYHDLHFLKLMQDMPTPAETTLYMIHYHMLPLIPS